MSLLLNDADLIDRIFSHIDGKSTDIGEDVWQEPTENYQSVERFEAEIKLMRRLPVPFCPSAALPEAGSWIARNAANTPLLVVRGDDGVVRAFRNACRHRGMAVAEGTGCSRAFVCPYHAWTYGLEGNLKHVPGSDGFPDLDPAEHGLVPVIAEERGGIVFITQDEPLAEGALEVLPDMFTPDQKLFDTAEFDDNANWKLIAETSMEGYHIKSLHNRSFFPYGFDNLNIVETFGPNSRIVFPFRRIEKLRDIPREKRRLSGMVTDVYQLFPNCHKTMLSNHSMLIILDPVSPTETHWIMYRMTNQSVDGKPVDLDEARRDATFVKDEGLEEDRHAACTIQAGLETRANSHMTFGKYEKGIVHFHSHLQDYLARMN